MLQVFSTNKRLFSVLSITTIQIHLIIFLISPIIKIERGAKMNKENSILHNEEMVNHVKKKMPPYNTITDLSDFFKILGDSTRLQIVMALEQGELCVSDLSSLLTMTISAISHQLKALRIAKLVKIRKEGKIVYYSLDDDHIHTLLEISLEHIKEK